MQGPGLRICLITRAMPPEDSLGATSNGVLLQLFAELGHDVVALEPERRNGDAATLRIGRAEVHALPGTPTNEIGAPFWTASAAAFHRMHRERPFDLLVGRGTAVWGVLSDGRLPNVPLILHEGTYPRWLHSLERRAPNLMPALAAPVALAQAWQNRIYRRCLQRAEVVVCNSPALSRALERVNWWHPPKTRFIPYGFDQTRFVAATEAAASEPAPRLVSMGRLTRSKGVMDMIDVLATLRDRSAVLDMVGPVQPDIRTAIETRAQRAGVAARVGIPGPVVHDDVPSRLAGASVFLFPSTHPEGLSKAVMEAMAAALPVVAYDIPGIRTLVEEGVSGFLVPPGDTGAMADRVDRLLKDPALRRAIGAAARDKLTREFSPTVIADRWRDLLGEVLARAARPSVEPRTASAETKG